MKKISVIIPCYNVEKYIDRCFGSLKSQTIGLEQMELIFVNDGSTDGTIDKLMEYEQQYPEHIIVINFEENHRQGTARNVAISYATAPYVGYVDADDFVEATMFEKMVNILEKYDCDFVECRWDFARDEEHRNLPDKLGEDGYMDLSKSEIKEAFIGSKIALVMSCDKVIKRSFLLDNNIFYPENLRHEDFFFSYLIFLYAKSCYCVEDVLYHYYINSESTVRQQKQEYHFDQMKVMVAFLETCVERGLLEENKNAVEWMFLEQYYVYMLWKVFEQFPERAYDTYLEMKETIYHKVPDYKTNPYRKWECNQFDNWMLKLLDYNLTRDSFEKIRKEILTKLHPSNPQDF